MFPSQQDSHQCHHGENVEDISDDFQLLGSIIFKSEKGGEDGQSVARDYQVTTELTRS